jgi:hydroxyacylglutathione hydrolase
MPSTTVGYEKAFGWAFQIEDEDEFVKALLDGQPEAPKYFAEMKKVNKVGPNVLNGMPNPTLQPAHRLLELVEQGAVVVDTRSAERFAAGHVAGTLNIPIEWLGSWAGWLLEYDQPFYLIADENNLAEAIHGLTYIGLDDVVGYFEADSLGVLAEHGVELQTYDMATPDELADDISSGDVVLVDVRGKGEWAEGHIPGAQHYMLGYLLDTADEIINGKPIVVQCQTGGRAAIGASILQAKGAEHVINMTGGFTAWETAGKAIEN